MSDKRFTVPNLIKAAAEGGRIFPDSVDLNPRFEQWGLPIRSQGSRGTCSVFAFVGLVEYAFAIRDGDGIILAGYRDDPAQPGGGVFMIRNSGGESRNGYMSYEYVRTYMNDGAWIEPTN